jgi:penicillin-binding protein 1A
LALGSGEVTLMSMAAAFAAFASEGMVPSPTLIRRVETTEGEVLLDGGPPPQRAISEATAYLMTHMMADVVDSGTAWTARRVGFRLPAAGKTGTTNDYYDAWFVGYTPNIVTGVWVGYDQPQTIVRNGYAAELAVPIWGRFMTTATRGDGRDWFKAPPTVTSKTICRITGKLATEHCRNVQRVDEDGYLSSVSTAYTEHFIRGTEPSQYCDLHERYEYIPDRMIATTGEGDPEPSTPATLGRRGRLITTAPGEAPTLAGGVAEAEPEPEIEPETAEPSERRGFWGRIFGRGRNSERPEP